LAKKRERKRGGSREKKGKEKREEEGKKKGRCLPYPLTCHQPSKKKKRGREVKKSEWRIKVEVWRGGRKYGR